MYIQIYLHDIYIYENIYMLKCMNTYLLFKDVSICMPTCVLVSIIQQKIK